MDSGEENQESDSAAGGSLVNGENVDKVSGHNDCGKQCTDGIEAVNSARPKSWQRQLVCNIPNGVVPQSSSESPKLNNNGLRKQDKLCNGASAVESVDIELQNNVDCPAIEKCPPPKVHSCSSKENVSLMVGTSSGYSGACSSSNSGADFRLDNLKRTNKRVDRRVPQKPLNDSDSSSDTGNEREDSLSGDECCIYTYKGDQSADLPRSFFRLADTRPGEASAGPSGLNRPPHPAHPVPAGGVREDGTSSPDMDFLEMDFDPDPSCGQDSTDEASNHEDDLAQLENHSNSPLEQGVAQVRNDLSAVAGPSHLSDNNLGSDSGQVGTQEEQPCSTSLLHNLSNNRNNDVNVSAPPSHVASTISRPGATCWPARDAWGHHSTGGDLCSPGDNSEGDGESWADTVALWHAGNMRIAGDPLLDARKFNLHSALYHCIMAKRLVLDKTSSFGEDNSNVECGNDGSQGDTPVERAMIWTEQEASTKQVTQIAASACGATAVVNVLLALGLSFTLECVKEGVKTRLRADTAPLPEYLFSRSSAGASHKELIKGLQSASNGAVYARFFHLYPDRKVSLSRWLAHWIRKGVVPIATLNLQHGLAPGNPVPDAWHHQMIFGVGPRGIYLTNPLECVREAALLPQLCSPPVLLIRRSDIVARWNASTDLRPLANCADVRWKRMNVLGQVVNVIRESVTQSTSTGHGRSLTSHVSIPASYCSGITMAVLSDSPAAAELRNSRDLPFADA